MDDATIYRGNGLYKVGSVAAWIALWRVRRTTAVAPMVAMTRGPRVRQSLTQRRKNGKRKSRRQDMDCS